MFILTRVLLYDKLLSQLIENKIKNKCSFLPDLSEETNDFCLVLYIVHKI